MKRFTGFCCKVMTFAVMVGILLSLVGAVSAQIYDPAQEGIVSSYYQVQNGMIRGIAPETAADKLAKVCLPEGVVPQTERLFTGLQLTAGQAALTVVVTGDLNGDGQASITDLLMVKTHLLGQTSHRMATGASVKLNAASVRSSILNNAKDGSIVLMHDLYGSTVDGAISAMQQMMAGDYEFVTVTELLSRNGTPPAPSVTYHRG